jgi:hypothetical protein
MKIDKPLRIGKTDDVAQRYAAQCMLRHLTNAGISCILTPIPYQESKSLFSLISENIINGSVDTAPIDLSSTPIFTEDHDIIATALAERNESGEGILFINGLPNQQNLTEKHRIVVTFERQAVQLQTLFPSIETIYKDADFPVSMLPIYQATGKIISKFEYNIPDNGYESYNFQPLHPKEMIPAPGMGISAFLCHKEDIRLRKMLNILHQPTSVAIANVERKLLQLAGNEYSGRLGAYCYRDKNRYFHFCAVRSDVCQSAFISQSTATGLSEKMFDTLFNNHNKK